MGGCSTSRPVKNGLFKHVQKASAAGTVVIVVNVACFAIACIGICTSVYIIGVDRTLWLDEASLASSFCQRSPLEIIIGGEFDYLQSAPLGWPR